MRGTGCSEMHAGSRPRCPFIGARRQQFCTELARGVALVALAFRLRRVAGAIGEISPHFFHVTRLALKAREGIQSFAAVLHFAKPPVHLGQNVVIRRRSSI